MADTPNPSSPEVRRKRLTVFITVFTIVMVMLLTGIWFSFIRHEGTLGAVLIGGGASMFAALKAWVDGLDRDKRAENISRIERVADANPEKAKPAWDLASAKLEAYAARNLSQIGWIFFLVLLVMGLGFCLIVWGVWSAYNDASFRVSAIASTSGLIVQFVGASFLLVYKSTMAQAKDYVGMLERINAVGMAAQLLEAIEDTDPKTKDAARIELAASLLTMYQPKGLKNRRRTREINV